MSNRLPPLNPLRAFEATARHCSVSLAAHELNVTHGAISHQIKALETALGIKLFERSSQKIKLTPQGALLLPTVSTAFHDIAVMVEKLSHTTASGELTIACVPGLLSLWLIPRLNELTEQFTDLRLTFIAANDWRNLLKPEIDICILYGDGNWSDCWVRLWSQLQFFPIASPALINNHPLKTLADLSDHVIFHGDDGREWKTWLTAADATHIPLKKQHFMSDARISTEAALLGHGIALGDSITAHSLITRGELIIPFNLSVPANNAFYVACRNEVRASPMVKIFVDWLFAALDEDLPLIYNLRAAHYSDTRHY